MILSNILTWIIKFLLTWNLNINIVIAMMKLPQALDFPMYTKTITNSYKTSLNIMQTYLKNLNVNKDTYRVERPVSRHLVSPRSANLWRVLIWISCPKRDYSPTICAPAESWVVEKDEEMSQMWPSKLGGGGQMVETKNHRTLGRLLPNTQKKVFESRSIAFMVPRWFVDHKVALL
jgi:hypothetical protein